MNKVDFVELRAKGFGLQWLTDPEQPDEPRRLALCDLSPSRLSPLWVDFLDHKTLHRLQQRAGRGEPFSRALGLSQERDLIDGTAGLGNDAFFAAALGFRVRAIERSPLVFALLADGFERFQAGIKQIRPLSLRDKLVAISDRLIFIQGDAASILPTLSEVERPDLVYLDPMYPSETRSDHALPKKPMQIFRRLFSDDSSGENVVTLFQSAIAASRERVVVKRPDHAGWFGDLKPTHSFVGKTARYDLYVRLISSS